MVVNSSYHLCDYLLLNNDSLFIVFQFLSNTGSIFNVLSFLLYCISIDLYVFNVYLIFMYNSKLLPS